jgi:hypothetical protein
MLAHVLTAIVFTLLGGLGYTVVFGSLENFAAKRAADKHTVGQFQQAIPLVIAVSLLLIAMRVINKAANAQGMDEYWLLINLQLLIMMYTDLMIDSFWAFLILKIVDGITFAGTGAMTVVVWLVFIVVGLACFLKVITPKIGPQIILGYLPCHHFRDRCAVLGRDLVWLPASTRKSYWPISPALPSPPWSFSSVAAHSAVQSK